MIKIIVSDFSRTILEPTDENYVGGLNTLHEKLKDNPDYNIWDHFKLNQNLLALYKVLNNQIGIYIFTTRYIQEYPPLKEKLKGIFKKTIIGSELGLKKDQAESYKSIAKIVSYSPNEILYIDDKIENIENAKKAGMATILFEDEKQAVEDINNIIK